MTATQARPAVPLAWATPARTGTPGPDVENRAGISRTTCGWRRPELARDDVRRYWRDVHSPAIARRQGVWWYRHNPYDAVRPDLFAPVAGITTDCPADQQLMWQSDVLYRDDAAVATFMRSPEDPQVTALLLADIEMIVDKSTTYRSTGDDQRTLLDRTGDPLPTGPRTAPTYGVFLRRRGEEPAFRDAVRGLARRWAETPGVARVRRTLFDTPDMEAERTAGYPVKTHPQELQYQAWIDLVVDDDAVARPLLDVPGLADVVSTAHAYPVPAMYTFVYDGAPTLIGLRGYPAWEAIGGLGAEHAADPRLLGWMYGDVVAGGAP